MPALVDPVLAQQQQDLLNSLQDKPTLLTLVGLVPGLQEFLLSKAGSVTVLAPTEEAFAKVPKVVTNFLTDPTNVDILRKVLQFHLISSDNNLLGESFPPAIQIENVLIPPSLQSAVSDLANSVQVVPSVQMMSGHNMGLDIPSWAIYKKPNNNWS